MLLNIFAEKENLQKIVIKDGLQNRFLFVCKPLLLSGSLLSPQAHKPQ